MPTESKLMNARSRLYIKAQPGTAIKVGSTLIFVLGNNRASICIEADTSLAVEHLPQAAAERLKASGKKL